jgi:hypothetical protein
VQQDTQNVIGTSRAAERKDGARSAKVSQPGGKRIIATRREITAGARARGQTLWTEANGMSLSLALRMGGIHDSSSHARWTHAFSRS